MSGPKRIGLLFGREWSFPPAFVEEVNRRDQDVVAEYIRLGGVPAGAPHRYDVIVDRISHEISFYRSYLKQAVLQGTYVINNPFWWSADDSFFEMNLAGQLGIAVPKTFLLPAKNYSHGIDPESLRNLDYPLDWQGMLDAVGTPAVLKDVMGGREHYALVDSLDSLLHTYDRSGQTVMLLQEYIEWDLYVRCFCIGREHVLPMPYDPVDGVYLVDEPILELGLRDLIAQTALRLNHALGYDMNCMEFAVRRGKPYAIDVFNPVPALDVNDLSPYYFEWTVKMLADFAIEMALNPRPQLTMLRPYQGLPE